MKCSGEGWGASLGGGVRQEVEIDREDGSQMQIVYL